MKPGGGDVDREGSSTSAGFSAFGVNGSDLRESARGFVGVAGRESARIFVGVADRESAPDFVGVADREGSFSSEGFSSGGVSV